jgi:hypothetical protein
LRTTRGNSASTNQRPARTLTQHVVYSAARGCNHRDDNRQAVFLHTMRNEHFGISLVEAMAAGNDA